MKNFNKIVGAVVIAIAMMSACSKENEQAPLEIAEDEVIEKKGLLLEGSQEVPAKNTKACGTLDVSYNKTTKMLTYTITWTDLTGNPVGAHIHGEAPRGINAGIKHDFAALIPKTTSGTFTNSVLVDEVAIKEAGLLAGLYYVNLHTPMNPGGEIRGQIEFEKAEIVSKKGLLLEGAQEVPAKTTAACGTLDITYNKTNKVLTYSITWTDLTGAPVGAHIHGEAPRGVNAGIKHDFAALIPKMTSGSFSNWLIVDEIAIKEKDLLDGLYYINIHTPLNPGGEIRGQFEFKKPDVISKKGLKIEGSQEVPAKNTGASGTMNISYNKTNKVLTYNIAWENLSGNPVGAHIHGEAPPGVNAGIKHDFTALLPKTMSGTFANWVRVDETAIKEAGLLNGLYYVNIHTPLNPAGEIRGQLILKK